MLKRFFLVAVLFSVTLLISLTSAVGQAQNAVLDSLEKHSFNLVAPNTISATEVLVATPKPVFQRFKFVVDSDTQIVERVVIGGTDQNPTFRGKFRKCVLFLCQTVEINGIVNPGRLQGTCDRNYVFSSDLTRSSALLTDTYDRMDLFVCLKNTTTGTTLVEVEGAAKRGPKYEAGGTAQREAFKLMKMQIKPLVDALKESYVANGARVLEVPKN